MSAILAVGMKAPHFKLLCQRNELVDLNAFLGQPIILAFYPADWSPVCSDQMALYNEILPLFEHYQAKLFGISVDSHWCHQAYSQHAHLEFPLLADFEPKGYVSKLYGVYRDAEGFSERALFVIDSQGIISWNFLSPMLQQPGADGILRALKNL